MTAQYTKMSDAPFHIGMLHGSVEGDAEHNRYAPFQMRELKENSLIIGLLAIYINVKFYQKNHALFIQGTYKVVIVRKQEKGAYLIELTKQGTQCSFFHTADVVWDEIEVCIDRLETVDELMTSLSTAMNECRREEKVRY